jgi:glycosyltransferase involved in cell wall biosynthesis
MKVAIVYDRVNKWGGAERVLLALHEIFPNAPLYTSLYSKEKANWAEIFPEVIPSFLQRFTILHDKHEFIPFIMPLVFENINLSDFDLVISVTSESAKGVFTGKNAIHVCYCLTPTRYLWSGYEVYFKNPYLRALSKPVVSYLRHWDRIASTRPDKMVAISKEVQKRIKRFYKRNSELIYPPVDIHKFKFKNFKRDKYFLLVSRLVAYKNVDLAIKAFNKLNLPLVIVGVGSQEKKLKQMSGKNIHFVGSLTDEELVDYYNSCQALIFPQIEDFGITAVEAIATGTPVIAFNKGGSKDIIKDRINGLFFVRQDVENLIESVYRFQKINFNRKLVSDSAKKFSKDIFKKKFSNLIKNAKR